MTNIEILGIGAPFIDHIMPVSEEFLVSLKAVKSSMEPVDYRTLQNILEQGGGEVTAKPGGSCANVIYGLSQLQHSCAFLGKIGNDLAGKRFLDHLKNKNIVSMLIPSETPTGQLVCLVTPDGERTFRNYLGCGIEFRANDLSSKDFIGVKLVHIEGYAILNDTLVATAMEMAKTAGALISFDLANFSVVQARKSEIIRLIGSYVDILFASRLEVKALTGLEPEKGCCLLKDLCDIAVVTMTAEGCWVGRGDQHMHCPAYPVKPLDSTGAGDIFIAGFLHGFLTGKDLAKCARYGAKAAAEVVQIYGAELPDETWQKIKTSVEVS